MLLLLITEPERMSMIIWETEGYKLRCDNTSPHASTEGGNSLLPFICKYIETGMFIDSID